MIHPFNTNNDVKNKGLKYFIIIKMDISNNTIFIIIIILFLVYYIYNNNTNTNGVKFVEMIKESERMEKEKRKPIFMKNCFNSHHKITWSDAINEIERGYKISSTELIRDKKSDATPPTFFCNDVHNSPFTGIVNATKEVYNLKPYDDVHFYISMSENSHTHGRHNDDEEDVIIISAIGTVSYKFDDGTKHTLEPGDALYIPKLIYHDPETHGPRVTLSIGYY
jgi:hypothetical protein